MSSTLLSKISHPALCKLEEINSAISESFMLVSCWGHLYLIDGYFFFLSFLYSYCYLTKRFRSVSSELSSLRLNCRQTDGGAGQRLGRSQRGAEEDVRQFIRSPGARCQGDQRGQAAGNIGKPLPRSRGWRSVLFIHFIMFHFLVSKESNSTDFWFEILFKVDVWRVCIPCRYTSIFILFHTYNRRRRRRRRTTDDVDHPTSFSCWRWSTHRLNS